MSESLSIRDVQEAVSNAQRTLSAADSCVGKMAALIQGRLRSGDVSGYVLKALKKELADYNVHTHTWKQK